MQIVFHASVFRAASSMGGSEIQLRGSVCMGSGGKDDDHFGSKGVGIMYDFGLLIGPPWIPSLEFLSSYI